ncbi:DinB family protein [Nocardioides sp. R-C-SC26]|uniref:DinB family protein n=1 Tax=Nocardioides sp. R-C-SC26 TaxID=2870414 RepID=UPI001E383016|nr:DinB family protein [Nocardioides sp. R-C-SC26]
MPIENGPDGSLRGARITDASLRGARFERCDLSDVVLRAVHVDGAEIDAPWLLEGEGSLVVNGIDVAPFVEAELNRRFPGRHLRRAADADQLRAAWAVLEEAWALAMTRADALPEDTLNASVDGEWSFAQTLRHLVLATDVWLRGAVLEIADPYHPLGMPHAEYATDGYDTSVFDDRTPTFAEVRRLRADRQAMVRDHLATLTDAELAVPRDNPWAPGHPETTLACLRTILEEEWEHLRFALRDLDQLTAS